MSYTIICLSQVNRPQYLGRQEITFFSIEKGPVLNLTASINQLEDYLSLVGFGLFGGFLFVCSVGCSKSLVNQVGLDLTGISLLSATQVLGFKA